MKFSPCLVVLILAPGWAWAAGAVLLFPAVGTPGQVTVSGRVLKDQPTNGSSTLSKNLRRLMVSTWKGARVEVRYGGLTIPVVSRAEGDFEATFSQKAPKTFPPGIQTAEASVEGADKGVAPVEIVAPDAPFFVVSDFDDTVAVSEVLSKHKLLTNALLKDESTQQAVKGMPAFYGCLREQTSKPAFALVSGSPVQFAPRIAAFLAKNDYPPMALYLRELGPTTLSDYKQPLIRVLMKAIPNKAVYVGDSGEHDPEVYRQMSLEFPDRVLRIYIRNAGRTEDKKRFEGVFLFNDPKEAALDAVAKGLASKECVTRAFP